jgi:hypothetical protein
MNLKDVWKKINDKIVSIYFKVEAYIVVYAGLAWKWIKHTVWSMCKRIAYFFGVAILFFLDWLEKQLKKVMRMK